MAAGNAHDGFARELKSIGYELQNPLILFGRDDVMGADNYMVVGRRISDSRYAVWEGTDWTSNPRESNRKRGYVLGNGTYDLTRAAAFQLANDRVWPRKSVDRKPAPKRKSSQPRKANGQFAKTKGRR